MKQKFFSSLIVLFIPLMALCQTGSVQDANIPKDAPVDVFMTDFKGRILPHEIVIFRSNLNGREYQD